MPAYKRISTNSLRNNQLIKASLLSLICAIVLSYILYSLTLTIDLPLGDHWRWIRSLLIPLINGEKSFSEYITGEYYFFSHSHMVTLFLVWINYHLFDLNYKYEFYIGLVSHLILVFWIIREYRNSVQETIKPIQILLLACLLIALILNPRNIIAWSLVQFEYFYLLFACALLITFSSFLKGSFPLFSLMMLIFIAFFLGDAMSIAAIFSIIGFIVCFEIKTHYATLLMIIALLTTGYFLANLLIPNIEMHSHVSMDKVDSLKYLLGNPIIILKFILKSCSQALLDSNTFKLLFSLPGWQMVQYLVGSIVLIFIFTAMVLFYYYRGNLITTDIPMLLIGFFLVSLLGVISTRLVEFGPSIGEAGRYMRIFQIGLVGATWINMTIIFQLMAKYKHLKKLLWGMALSTTLVIMFAISAHTFFSWKYYGSVLENRQNVLNALIIYSEDSNFDVGAQHRRCKNDFCLSSVQFLKEHQLSIFRDQ